MLVNLPIKNDVKRFITNMLKKKITGSFLEMLPGIISSGWATQVYAKLS